MPAITAIEGFALRNEKPPPYGNVKDVIADRQHANLGFLMPRPNPLATPKLGKNSFASSQSFGLLSSTSFGHPTEPSPSRTRYASVTDAGRVPPKPYIRYAGPYTFKHEAEQLGCTTPSQPLPWEG